MNYAELLRLQKKLIECKSTISAEALSSYEKSFEIEYAHHSTAIEGNTMSLIETKVILEDGLSVGGKSLREIYEIVNHNQAFEYVKRCIAEGKPLSEEIVKDIHALLMDHIIAGGFYRNEPVRITGASHKSPYSSEMYQQIKFFYGDLSSRNDLNPIEYAAWTHAEFVRIHPFTDGNGRTARMIMNYQLMANGFLPVSIQKEQRLAYYEALDKYAAEGKLQPFADMIAQLEKERLTEYIGLMPQTPTQRSGRHL